MPQPAHLKLRIELARGHLGPGKIELLENIVSEGSLAAAARAMQMSYKRAWELLAATNDIFNEPVAVTRPGRNTEGSTQLTPLGERVIALYRGVERRATRAAPGIRASRRVRRGIRAAQRSPGVTSRRSDR